MKIKQLLILSAAALSLAACGEHTHSFGDAWKSDDTSHWHECECGEKSGKADHLDTNADGKCDTCNHEMEVPAPTGTEVTKEEWMASIGMEKPFLFADNYKFNMLAKVNGVDFAEENFYADGNKFKDEPVKAPEGETLGNESYYSFENSKYIAYQFTGGKWSTHETSSTPIHDIIQTSLAPFGNPDLFTYDETSMSYKCETTTMGATFTNLEIKFVEKKITKTTFTVQGADYICSLTYGGQTVTLPDIPEPSYTKMTEEQFNALLNKIQKQGFAVFINVETETEGVEVSQISSSFSFKYDVASLSSEELFYMNNQLFDGTILKDLKEYSYQNGSWKPNRTLTNEQAQSCLEGTIEFMFWQLFPSLSYTDFNFNENTGKYTVDKTITTPQHEQEMHYVYTYTMDANGISKIEGLMSGMEEEGVYMISRIATTSIDIGSQTITKPDVPQPSVNEVTSSEWEAALGLEKPFLFADNYKFNTLVKENGVYLAENNFYADGNKLKYERMPKRFPLY